MLNESTSLIVSVGPPRLVIRDFIVRPSSILGTRKIYLSQNGVDNIATWAI